MLHTTIPQRLFLSLIVSMIYILTRYFGKSMMIFACLFIPLAINANVANSYNETSLIMSIENSLISSARTNNSTILNKSSLAIPCWSCSNTTSIGASFSNRLLAIPARSSSINNSNDMSFKKGLVHRVKMSIIDRESTGMNFSLNTIESKTSSFNTMKLNAVEIETVGSDVMNLIAFDMETVCNNKLKINPIESKTKNLKILCNKSKGIILCNVYSEISSDKVSQTTNQQLLILKSQRTFPNFSPISGWSTFYSFLNSPSISNALITQKHGKQNWILVLMNRDFDRTKMQFYYYQNYFLILSKPPFNGTKASLHWG